MVDLGVGAAAAIRDGQQVGSANDHAALWSGTAESLIDLNPANWTQSVAVGVRGGQQVGSATRRVPCEVNKGDCGGGDGTRIQIHPFLVRSRPAPFMLTRIASVSASYCSPSGSQASVRNGQPSWKQCFQRPSRYVVGTGERGHLNPLVPWRACQPVSGDHNRLRFLPRTRCYGVAPHIASLILHRMRRVPTSEATRNGNSSGLRLFGDEARIWAQSRARLVGHRGRGSIYINPAVGFTDSVPLASVRQRQNRRWANGSPSTPPI